MKSLSRYFMLTLGICAIAFSSCTKKNSLKGFARQGPQALFEVTDKDGQSWKIYSVETPNVKTFSVINKSGQVDARCYTFTDSAGVKHALVFADSSEKEKALAVLDKNFLSGLANSSDEYKIWLKQNAVFGYSGGRKTRTIDVQKGGLGSSDLKVEGNKIVGTQRAIACHCGEMVCIGYPSPIIDCINKLCDWANCQIAHGDLSACAQEQSDVQISCSLATNQVNAETPQPDPIVPMTNGLFILDGKL
jgi:hypothetical protein